ncbi:hypothetical protein B0T19DRAFT_3631 [Cercophora scortea]|uniref:Ankyrin n=1 Tax=Cercophora scortea TaxID=314031 RepID=A0AAE0J1N2_9PEZI|nr:hypothetical protein B0T19DRAFT_3631 [Cercophora scortea]
MINDTDYEGLAALQYAAHFSWPFVLALLNAGADPNGPTFSSNSLLTPSPLIIALASNQDTESVVEIVSALLRANADPNLKCRLGLSPLHYALAREDGFTLAAILIRAGADLRLDPNDMFAAGSNRRNLMKLHQSVALLVLLETAQAWAHNTREWAERSRKAKTFHDYFDLIWRVDGTRENAEAFGEESETSCCA